MGNSPDQFCGYCGKAREPGETACLRCGNPYSEAYAGSPGNTQAPATLSPTELARRVTQISQGSTPPPQYSGVMPPAASPSDNTSSPNYFGGMPNHFGGVPPVTPLLGNTPPGMSAPETSKKSLSLAVKIGIGQGVLIALLLIVLIVVLLGRGNTVPSLASTPTATATPAILATPMATATATSVPTATATPGPTDTATLVPTPGPLCSDVGTWTGGTQDWETLNGVLLNNGTKTGVGYTDYNGGPTIVAPCALGNAANYAVVTKIQVTGTGSGDCDFGITVRGSSSPNGWQGYNVTIGTCNGANIYGPNTTSVSNSFNPGKNVHTYRIEVKDNTIKLLVDGATIAILTDNVYLTGSQVGLWCANLQLSVFSFQVTLL